MRADITKPFPVVLLRKFLLHTLQSFDQSNKTKITQLGLITFCNLFILIFIKTFKLQSNKFLRSLH